MSLAYTPTIAADRAWSAGDEFPLAYPVTLRNTKGEEIETISSVTLRRLTGKDLADVADAHAKGKGHSMRIMVCRCANIAPSSFDQLDAADVTALGEIAAAFTGGALQTGET